MERVESWERHTEWPLTIAALVFLVSYAIPIAAPGLPEWASAFCDAVVWTVWGLFAADFAARFWLAGRHRGRFVKENLLDLAVVALPLLRPLRLIRLLALVSILNRVGSHGLRGRVVTYTAGGTVLLVTVGALAITEAERGEPGATINTLGDGFWWAFTTITTVGYGDRYPVTSTGRFVAAALMVSGVALLGVITATIASWLVERVSEVTETEEAVTRAQVDRLAEEVHELRTALNRMLPKPESSDSAGRAESSPRSVGFDG